MLDSIYLDAILLIFIGMNMVFLLAMLLKDNSIVDIYWGLGFVWVNGVIEYLYPDQRGSFLWIAVTIWGCRLALYLLIRWKNKGEDWRYAKWKKEWGRYFFVRSYFQVYLLQGICMYIISLPLLQLETEAPSFKSIQIIGILISSIGILYEAIADYQLFRFKKVIANKGKIMNSGLWKYSRHPNYFGEMLVWWGIFIYIIPYGNLWISLLSPLLITFLLAKVSGAPMLESRYKENKSYKAYIDSTNTFIPWFPKAK